MQSGERHAPTARLARGLLLAATLLTAGVVGQARATDAPPGLLPALAGAGAEAASCKGEANSLTSLAMANTTACEDCDSNQGYCTPGNNVCRNYCLNLVGLEGICHQSCNCCVCPEVPPPPPPSGGGGGVCQPVCRCDGVPGPQGLCPSGCRQVSCI